MNGPAPRSDLRRAVAALAVTALLAPLAPAMPRAAQNAAAEPTADATSPRNASYTIEVRLDPAERTLDGREVLQWRNISTLTTSELQFHLYYNAWKNTRSTWMRERLLRGGRPVHTRPEEDWGWIDVTSIRLFGPDGTPATDVTAEAHYIAPDDGNVDDQTVLVVPLPRTVAPGETIDVELEWTSRVPRTFARTGTIGDYFFFAHWFPKIGVLEDTGWNSHQFHAATEFYADYGIYDVEITVPADWVVGATGVEQSVRANADGSATHRYRQADVHDFAWTTSPDFIERRERFEHPGLPPVEMRLLLQPEHRSQAARHFEATRGTLRYYGEWFGAYPYPQVTIVDPAWQSGSGGMEYPTFFTAGTRWLAPSDVSTPEEVTIHEAGHQFFHGVVGNNEFEHAWLDEGLNTYATARAMETFVTPNYRSTRFFGRFVPWVFRDIPWSRAVDGNRLAGYRRHARMDTQATPTYRYWPSSASSISYNKTALWLHTLERHLGWSVVRQGMAAFYQRWQFGHPSPQDFLDSLQEASGRDLSWFFDQVHGGTQVFDYGLQDLTSQRVARRGFFDTNGSMPFVDEAGSGQYETRVVVRRYEDGTFPVEVRTVFEDGHEEHETWDGKTPWTAYTYLRDARATEAWVDPERVLLLDIDYTNNSRTLSPRAETAATKWSIKWLVWLQDLLLTYGFFL